jgi:hypothetical protein
MSLHKWTSLSYWIAVRAECGERAGQLISNFLVDRRSGNVMIGETIPMERPPRQFIRVRDSVLQRARVRGLYPSGKPILSAPCPSDRLEA